MMIVEIIGFLFDIADVKGHQKVVVCYVGTWATYRTGEGSFDLLAHFNPNLCTHLIYTFAGLDNETNLIKVMDPFLDLETDYGKGIKPHVWRK